MFTHNDDREGQRGLHFVDLERRHDKNWGKMLGGRLANQKKHVRVLGSCMRAVRQCVAGK